MNFRNDAIDRRRMPMNDRSDYSPSARLDALSRTKAYKGNIKFDRNSEKFSTEQKPGTGGQNVGGIWQQQARMQRMSEEKQRAESFRPEKKISEDIYDELYSINDTSKSL